jgi:hypothetical protein
MIHDYFIEYEKSNALSSGAAPGQYETANNLKLGNDWVDSRPDPNQTVHPESE